MRSVPDQRLVPIIRRLAVLAALTSTPLHAQARGFTIEQALSAPFPSEMTAAPVGGAAAWIFNQNGSRNIWIATPPDYQARALTAYAGDDGQNVTGLEWTPDARALVYTRGGDANGSGEYPNPTLETEGVEQDIWIVALGGTPRKIGEGKTAAVSPIGRRVAFIRRGQVWWAPLDSGDATLLIRTRGNASSIRWSPDGRRLAFVSARSDHAFIGVFDTADSSLKYLNPSTDQDGYAVWAPDSRQVAFIRIPTTTRQAVRIPHREGEPWSIWVADAVTGQSKEVWKADRGPGSVFRAVQARDQVQWTASGWLVFPWERDGWTHLYAVTLVGGRPIALTPGDFEVEQVVLAPNRQSVTFSSNQGDADRRHLWNVAIPATATGPTALTGGAGIEWEPAVSSDGDVTFLLRSDARGPARPALMQAGRAPQDLAPQVIPADFPSSQLVLPQAVVLQAADGQPIHGQVFLPPDLRAGERRPAIVFFHGGPRTQMLLGWHTGNYYHRTYAFNQYLASRGYVVLSVNYRAGTGYGLNFREAIGFGPTGASEYNDIQGAASYLRGRPDVDPARIGTWGGSWGGFLVALALARASDMFAAGVDLHGVHDWNLEWDPLVPGWDTEKDLAARRLAFTSSPMADLKTWRSPVLLIQGDDDRDVNFANQIQLREDLRKQGVAVDEIVFPDEVHGFLTHGHWVEAYTAAAAFFDKHLAPPPKR
ncbi:MAG: S9 family peptidase [Gemmatimonadetes bacterium]|nr:S9 family peptidase [Gemmatimonadota bacterium]